MSYFCFFCGLLFLVFFSFPTISSASLITTDDVIDYEHRLSEILQGNEEPLRALLAPGAIFCVDSDCAAGVANVLAFLYPISAPAMGALAVLVAHTGHIFKDDMFFYRWQTTYSYEDGDGYCFSVRNGVCTIKYKHNKLIEAKCIAAPFEAIASNLCDADDDETKLKDNPRRKDKEYDSYSSASVVASSSSLASTASASWSLTEYPLVLWMVALCGMCPLLALLVRVVSASVKFIRDHTDNRQNSARQRAKTIEKL